MAEFKVVKDGKFWTQVNYLEMANVIAERVKGESLGAVVTVEAVDVPAPKTHFVKGRKLGEAKFYFVGESGRMVRLRFHALRYTQAEAIQEVAGLTPDNLDWEFKVQAMPKPRKAVA